MAAIARNFLRGLGVVLPLTLTVWLVVWLARGAETLLREVFVFFLSERHYLPGLGVLLGFLIVCLAGLLVRVFVFRRIWQAVEGLVARIPIVKTIFGSIQDFLGYLSPGAGAAPSKVASVEVAEGIRMIGLVTANSPRALSGLGNDLIAVYLPMSYQVGGFTVLVPEERVEILDVPVEEAMRFILTAGIRKGEEA